MLLLCSYYYYQEIVFDLPFVLCEQLLAPLGHSCRIFILHVAPDVCLVPGCFFKSFCHVPLQRAQGAKFHKDTGTPGPKCLTILFKDEVFLQMHLFDMMKRSLDPCLPGTLILYWIQPIDSW